MYIYIYTYIMISRCAGIRGGRLAAPGGAQGGLEAAAALEGDDERPRALGKEQATASFPTLRDFSPRRRSGRNAALRGSLPPYS